MHAELYSSPSLRDTNENEHRCITRTHTHQGTHTHTHLLEGDAGVEECAVRLGPVELWVVLQRAHYIHHVLLLRALGM